MTSPRAGAPSTTQRWGVIGTGAVSRSVVPDLASCPGVEIAVVHSRDAGRAERFAREFGIPRWTGDYEAVLADAEVDAVYVATPFALHHAMVRAALLAGKHVLVEKPMALDAAEVADLFTTAAAQGVFLMEAMWMKFGPVFQRLHQEIADGRIGVPRSLRATFGLPWPQDGGSRWDRARSGSALLDQGIYPVTLAQSVFGTPTSVAAAGIVRADGVDLAQHLTLEFGDGRFAQCAVSMTEFADPSAAVSGTAGWIVLPAPFWAGTALEFHGWETLRGTPERVEFPLAGSGYVPMLRSVVDAIGDGRVEHPVHGAGDTLAVFATLDQIRAQLTRAG